MRSGMTVGATSGILTGTARGVGVIGRRTAGGGGGGGGGGGVAMSWYAAYVFGAYSGKVTLQRVLAMIDPAASAWSASERGSNAYRSLRLRGATRSGITVSNMFRF